MVRHWLLVLVPGLAGLLAAGCVSVRPLERARAEMVRRPPAELLRVGGRTVHVERFGDWSDPADAVAGPAPAPTPTLVLLHGFGGSAYSWRKVAPMLAAPRPGERRGYRVLTLDLHGFGLSARPEDPEVYTPEGQAGLVAEVLEVLGVEGAVHLVGHSFGGGVAMVLARKQPERVASLTLVDTTLPTHSRAPQADLPLYRPVAYVFLRTVGLRRLFVRGALRKAFHDDSLVTPDLVDAYRDRLRLRGASSLYRSLTLPIPRRRLGIDLAEIEHPTLVVWGVEDELIPVEAGRKAAKKIPGARFVAIEGSGHVPMEERPEELVEVVSGFVEEVRTRGDGRQAGDRD